MNDSFGQLIFLNGTSSSGKTTLARTLQELLDTPYYHRSLDDFRQGYLERFWLADDGILFRRTLDAYLLSLHALVTTGHNVIAETLMTPERLPRYLDLFSDLPVFFVGVYCPLAEAERRERHRRDRLKGPVDIAEQYPVIHAHGIYDLEVDTSTASPDEAARVIQAASRNFPAPSAFQRLRSHPQ